MADGSTIEWLALPGYKGATWNPARGCSRQGEGCTNCWAIGQARRQDTPGGAYEGLTTLRRGRVDWTGVSRPVPEMLDRPLRWRSPRCIFVESMGDLWHPGIPYEYAAAVLGVCNATTQHVHIILTKQSKRMRAFFDWLSGFGGIGPYIRGHAEQLRGFFDHGIRTETYRGRRVRSSEDAWSKVFNAAAVQTWPLPNVALLVSAWDQASADRYIPDLLATPAAVRGVSAEPLLGAMDLREVPTGRVGASDYCSMRDMLHWVIAGGESGPKARPMHPDWARSLRDQCVSAGVPFFFKQWGEHAPWLTEEWLTRGAEERRPHAWVSGDGDHGHCWLFDDDGSWSNWTGSPPGNGVAVMSKIGKHSSGRELDGCTWDEFPKAWT